MFSSAFLTKYKKWRITSVVFENQDEHFEEWTLFCCHVIFLGPVPGTAPTLEKDSDNLEPQSKRRKTHDGKINSIN